MVKGITRQVIFVKSPDPRLFEEAIFIVKEEALAREGRCVVMSTHSPEHPFAVGNKVLLMRGGKAAAFGPPGEVITPRTLEKVYGVEMDVLTVEDRYGRKRTVCLPVRQADSRPWRRC